MGTYKYGVWIPRNVKEALEVDKKNGNNLWREAIVKEISALWDMKVFKLLGKGQKQKNDTQFAPLRLLFDVKQDGRRKARLVIGGHVVDPTGYDTYASNMKTISARLLMLIASTNKYQVLSGNIGNAYLWADGNMPIVTKLGPEFTLYNSDIPVGSFASVEKALYGLPTSANRWHAMLSDTLRSMGFKPTRYDSDVWYRPDGNHHYEYIGTHTDDILCVGREPRGSMEKLRDRFTIKKIEEPSYHLGCDYRRNEDGTWSIGTKTYVQECLKRIAQIVNKMHDGKPALGFADTPMVEKYQPELDKSPLLSLEDHRKYQQLIGTAQWLITIGRLDLGFTVSSLSRFSAAPRQGHLDAAIRMFKYINKKPEYWTKMDASDHKPYGPVTTPYDEAGEADWSQHYPGAVEEIDLLCPNNGKGRGRSLSTTVYFDSNFAHDEVTRRSITGILTFVGNTPVAWISKRQGAIATSTYSAELCAARMACEEAISIRYMLRSLGVPLLAPTDLIGDNYGSLASVNLPGSPCKKKASSISYHYVRECNAKGIIRARHIASEFNLADGFTKALGRTLFWDHMNMICPKGPWSVKRTAEPMRGEQETVDNKTRRRKRRRRR